MTEKKKSVLLLEAYTRQVLPIAKGFHRLGWRVLTLNSSRLDLGNATRYADRKIIVDSAILEDETWLMATIDVLLETEKIDLIVPLSDFSANTLSKNKERLSGKVRMAVNDPDVFSLAYDKLRTMELCQALGVPCPATPLSPSSVNEIEALGYPLVAKPRSACGSIGFHVIPNGKELVRFMTDQGDSLSTYLFQQYIPASGTQYNAHLFLNEAHQVQTAIVAEKVRFFPIDGGASTFCRTVNRPDIVKTCEKLLTAMKWVGYCDVDLILDPRDQQAKVIEVNARISANVMLCFQSGADIAGQIAQCYCGEDVTAYPPPEKEARLRCLHTDLLWFLKSPKRFSSDPSWFSFRNTKDQIFALSDPLPFFTFSLQSMFRYRTAMQARKR